MNQFKKYEACEVQSSKKVRIKSELLSEITQILSENKLKQEEIKLSLSELEQIFKYSQPMCVIDKDFNIIRINDTFAKLFQISSDETMCEKCYNIWQGHLCNTSECLMHKILEGKTSSEYEYNRENLEGKKICCIITAYPYKSLEGEIIGIIETITDITERKDSTRKLQESELKYRFITENANDIIIVLNQNLKIEFINEQVSINLWGYWREDLLNQPLLNLVHPEDLEKAETTIRNTFKLGAGQISLRLKKKTQEFTWFEIKIKAFFDGKGEKKLQLILRDVSERIKKEIELKKANFELNQITNITIPLCVIDRDFNIIRINNTFASLLQLSNEDIIGKKCFNRLTSPFCHTPKCTLRQILAGKKNWNYEKTIVSKDGSKIICNMKAVPYRGIDGNIRGIIQNYIDITEKKLDEKLIRDLAKFPAENPSPVLRVKDGYIAYANKKARDILGIENNQPVPGIFLAYIERSYNTNKILKIELKLKNRFYSFIFTPIKELGYINIYGREITEQKQAEQDLQKRNSEISTLLKTSKIVLKHSQFSIASKLIFESYSKLMEVSNGFIGLLSSDQKFINVLFSYSEMSIREMQKEHPRFSAEIMSSVIFAKKAIYKNKIDAKLGSIIPNFHFKVKNIMFIPMLINNEVKGIIGLANKPTDFTKNDLNLATAFAEILSIAYVNCETLETLEKSNKEYKKLSNELEQRVEERTKKLKESEEKIRNLVNNLSDVLIEFDIMGTITYISSQIFELFEYQPKVIIGSNISEKIHPDDINNLKNELEKMQNPDDIFYIELRMKHNNGYFKPISINGSLVEINSEYRIIAILRDITEQKLIDEMMEKEIKKLRELEQIRSDLIKRISHELKTPLISIFSGSQFLLNHYDKKNTNTVQSIIELINVGGYRLKSLVDNLIMAYDIESENIELSKNYEDIVSIINHSIEDLISQANKRHIFINTFFPQSLYLDVDKSRMHLVFSNIISNAIKNTQSNGNIFIKIHNHSKNVDIIIQDDGIGLTPKEAPFLFKKFGKIERYGKNLDVDIEGAGLGLYIASRIVNLHDGRISFKSKGRNKGTTFIISLNTNE